MRTLIPAAWLTVVALLGAPGCGGSDDDDDDLYFAFDSTGGMAYPGANTGAAPSSSTGGAPSSSTGAAPSSSTGGAPSSSVVSQSSDCPTDLPDIAQPCTSPSTPCTYLGYSCTCDSSTGTWTCSGIVSASVGGTGTGGSSSGTGGAPASTSGGGTTQGGAGTGGASSAEDNTGGSSTQAEAGTGGASDSEDASGGVGSTDEADIIGLCPRPAPSTGDSCPDLTFSLTCTYGGDLAPEGGTRSCDCEDETWDCTDSGRGSTGWGG